MKKQRSLKMYNSSKNITSILESILSNQDFLRMTKYLDARKDPLDREKYPDVRLRDVRRDNVVYTPYNANIVTDQQVYIFIYPYRHSFPNTTLSTSIYNIEIVIPYDSFVIDLPQGIVLRGEEMAQRVVYELDQQHIVGAGETSVVGVENVKLNDKYMLTAIQLQVYNASTKEFL